MIKGQHFHELPKHFIFGTFPISISANSCPVSPNSQCLHASKYVEISTSCPLGTKSPHLPLRGWPGWLWGWWCPKARCELLCQGLGIQGNIPSDCKLAPLPPHVGLWWVTISLQQPKSLRGCKEGPREMRLPPSGGKQPDHREVETSNQEEEGFS
jgi:hypothetical protein